MHIFRLSQKVAAELLGVSPRTLRDWTDAPRNPDGSYAGPALVQWMLDRRSPDGDAFDDQRQRLAAAQAEKVEAENAIRRGELADIREVEKLWTDFVANARARLLRLPSDVGREVPAELRAAVESAARRAVRGALSELADNNPPEAATK